MNCTAAAMTVTAFRSIEAQEAAARHAHFVAHLDRTEAGGRSVYTTDENAEVSRLEAVAHEAHARLQDARARLTAAGYTVHTGAGPEAIITHPRDRRAYIVGR